MSADDSVYPAGPPDATAWTDYSIDVDQSYVAGEGIAIRFWFPSAPDTYVFVGRDASGAETFRTSPNRLQDYGTITVPADLNAVGEGASSLPFDVTHAIEVHAGDPARPTGLSYPFGLVRPKMSELLAQPPVPFPKWNSDPARKTYTDLRQLTEGIDARTQLAQLTSSNLVSAGANKPEWMQPPGSDVFDELERWTQARMGVDQYFGALHDFMTERWIKQLSHIAQTYTRLGLSEGQPVSVSVSDMMTDFAMGLTDLATSALAGIGGKVASHAASALVDIAILAIKGNGSNNISPGTDRLSIAAADLQREFVERVTGTSSHLADVKSAVVTDFARLSIAAASNFAGTEEYDAAIGELMDDAFAESVYKQLIGVRTLIARSAESVPQWQGTREDDASIRRALRAYRDWISSDPTVVTVTLEAAGGTAVTGAPLVQAVPWRLVLRGTSLAKNTDFDRTAASDLFDRFGFER